MICNGVTVKITELEQDHYNALTHLHRSSIPTLEWNQVGVKDNTVETERTIVIYFIAVDREDVADALQILDKV